MSLPFETAYSLDNQCVAHKSAGASGPDPEITGVPDYPHVAPDTASVHAFLEHELATPVIDSLYPHLWFVAAREPDRVDPLHRQVLKNLRIVVAEDPQLHLIWTTGTIYLKPLPSFLLNAHFWRRFLARPPEPVSHSALIRDLPSIRHDGAYLHAQALGFMISYLHLIRSPSDLAVAHAHSLVPGSVTWPGWARLSARVRQTSLPVLAPSSASDHSRLRWRYRYGQLRLRRLDWAVTLFGVRGTAGSRWWYFRAYTTIDPWLKEVFAVLALAYAFASILMAAMQVALQAGTLTQGNSISIFDSVAAANVLGGFSLFLIVGTAASLVLISFVATWVFVWQIAWGWRRR